MLNSRLRSIRKSLSTRLSQFLLSQKESYILLNQRHNPKAITQIHRQIRRRAIILMLIGTLSFVLGIGYGFTQRYRNDLKYTEIDDYTEVKATPNIAPVAQAPRVAPNINITIKAVGDIVPGTDYPRNKLHPNKKVLFQSVKSLLKGADFLFGNFESTLTDYPYSPKGTGGGLVIPFRTPPSYTQILKDAGFHIMSIANNHSLDFAQPGLDDTIANLEKVGIKALGKKGQILIAHYKDLSIAWIGFSYFDFHNSMNNLPKAKALVQKASQNADIVVISVHAGAEGTGAMRVRNKTEFFAGENRGNMVQFSRAMIDSGADLILGHSPHVPRALELYKGKLVAYSLGNFMGYRTLSSSGELGYSLVLEAKLNNRGDFISGRIIPVHINRQGIPFPDSQGRSIRLIQKLTRLDFPATPLVIQNDGQILVKNQKKPQ